MLPNIGKYEIRCELGRGAMGIVYEGFDPFIERKVAIKTIQKSRIDRSEAQDALARFRREAQAAGRLTHPNIVSVYEYGDEGDIAFIAMEFIVGRELKSFFDNAERFHIQDSLRVMHQLLDALDYSHERGVIHRDIKPSNIIITKDNQIKVVDFGIAKIEASELTQAGTVLGTPAYMSPEQFQGLDIDLRSDLYSAGVVLYQLLTGNRPFTGNPTTLMHKVLSQAPALPSVFNPAVSAFLDAAVKKAMSKNAEDRFQTAAEFKLALNLVDASSDSSMEHAADDDATLVSPRTAQPARVGDETPYSALSFDLATLSTNIANKMDEARRDTAHQDANHQEISQSDQELILALQRDFSIADAPDNPIELTHLVAALKSESELLPNDRQSNNSILHQKLGEIANFLEALARNLNLSNPPISRTYSLNRWSVYTNLQCRSAHTDRRDNGKLLEQVSISASLFSPNPVMTQRKRDMVNDLKTQLEKLQLQSLDDLDTLAQGAPEDWVRVHLAPNFPMQIKFTADYAENRIAVHGINIESFGHIDCSLKSEDVTPALLNDISLLFFGKADKLPTALSPKVISKAA